MKGLGVLASVALLCAAVAHAQDSSEVDLKTLFGEPVVLNDQDGKPIVTRKAMGHPVVVDWNSDGKNDILLGAKNGMSTRSGLILVLKNVGTNEKPAFKWPPKSLDVEGADFTTNCGCTAAGLELMIQDWNGDGHFDIVADTYWTMGVRVLLNKGKPKEAPSFSVGKKFKNIRAHGKGSGGGDWNKDGIGDYLFPVNCYGWTVYPGKLEGKAHTFGEKAVLRSGSFTLKGHEKYKLKGKANWFDASPYAWNFSGIHGKDSQITEVVAMMMDRVTKPNCDINYYWLDSKAKTCTLKGTIAVNEAGRTRLSIGDLNGDGCMDLLYSGGVYSKGDETKVWVIYGKVKNANGSAKQVAEADK